MNSLLLTRLINFLQEELLVPAESIQMAMRQQEFIPNLFPMVLWQYGLISVDQLNQIFDWLETA